MNSNSGMTKRQFKEGVIVSLKITFIFALLFTLINQNFSFKAIGYTFLISAMYSFGLGFIQGIINDSLSNKWDWIEHTNTRIWAGIVTTFLYTVPVVLLIDYVNFIVISGHNIDRFFSGRYLWQHVFYIILSFGVSAFIHARGFMIQWKNAVKQESTKQEIVAKTETAKFESLKNQLDPHFLFNSLNVLTSLIGEIEEELKFAKTYMELLGMRFEEAVQFNIPDNISNNELKIVPLSLQLLLENAVKHNVVSTSKPLTINIYEEGSYLIITNNVNPKEAIGKSTKIGLQNIADRYGLITEKGVKIENNNKTFKVSLPLLYKMNNMMYTDDLENSKYVRAVKRVEKLKEFYQNLASYCIVIPFLIFINLRFSPGFYWFWFPMFGWGIGLTFHFLEVNNYNVFLGKNWEEKKIEQLMKKQQNKYK